MAEFAQKSLEQVKADQWTLMQEVFTVPPEAYAASFKLMVTDYARLSLGGGRHPFL